MADISNRDDVIDSRDVIARIEELSDERIELTDAISDAEEDAGQPLPPGFCFRHGLALLIGLDNAVKALEEWDDDNGDKLKALQSLAEQAEGYADDWRHGATLIRDSYFEDYAQELAEDIGAIDRNASWPNTCIDWGQAARELQQDYTSVDFDGETYWVR